MTYGLSSDFVIRDIVDECIVVPTKSEENTGNGFFALNSTGKIIINGIKDGKETDAIISEICDKYEIDRDSAQADVIEFIGEFKKLGIIIEL